MTIILGMAQWRIQMGFCSFYRNPLSNPEEIFQFTVYIIFDVHGLKYINYLNIQVILLPDILRLL